jgi:uncharacterized protein YgbK (DUF1537 family)
MAGLRTVVATGPDNLHRALRSAADVIGVSTNSRDLPAAEAQNVCATVAQTLGGIPLWFKKIDSRLKGNIASEWQVCAACADLTGC